MAIINHDDLSKNVFIVEFDHKCQLIPIVRQDSDAIDPSEGESFPDTVRREQKIEKLIFVQMLVGMICPLMGKVMFFLVMILCQQMKQQIRERRYYLQINVMVIHHH